MTKLQENVAACANVPTQYAAIEAFSGRADVVAEEMRKEFERRRNVMVEGINSIDKLHCNCPKGTFYVFANISETGMGSIEFANRLLDEAHVAVVPGVAYGDNYDNYVRIAFTMKEERIKEGLERIRSFVADL
jgi:aminotransferase